MNILSKSTLKTWFNENVITIAINKLTNNSRSLCIIRTQAIVCVTQLFYFCWIGKDFLIFTIVFLTIELLKILKIVLFDFELNSYYIRTATDHMPSLMSTSASWRLSKKWVKNASLNSDKSTSEWQIHTLPLFLYHFPLSNFSLLFDPGW